MKQAKRKRQSFQEFIHRHRLYWIIAMGERRRKIELAKKIMAKYGFTPE